MEKVLQAKGHLNRDANANVTKAQMVGQVATLAKPKQRKKPTSSRAVKLTNVHLLDTHDWLRPDGAPPPAAAPAAAAGPKK
jgi:hypothetical protein